MPGRSSTVAACTQAESGQEIDVDGMIDDDLAALAPAPWSSSIAPCACRAEPGRPCGSARRPRGLRARRAPGRPRCSAVMMGARPGSSEKCGLPEGCTSPPDRSTRVVGTSSTSTPRETSIRPRPPRMMLGLLAPSMATSAHASRSRPFSITASARRSLSIMLGFTSASWKFCVPRVRLSTSTRSPPTASASDLRSGMVATTRSLDAPGAGGTSTPPRRSALLTRTPRPFTMLFLIALL